MAYPTGKNLLAGARTISRSCSIRLLSNLLYPLQGAISGEWRWSMEIFSPSQTSTPQPTKRRMYDTLRVPILIFAGNIWILASSRRQLQSMIKRRFLELVSRLLCRRCCGSLPTWRRLGPLSWVTFGVAASKGTAGEEHTSWQGYPGVPLSECWETKIP